MSETRNAGARRALSVAGVFLPVMLACAGCSAVGTVREDCPADEGYRVLRRVSLQRGARLDSCGPSALAAVLNYWDDPVTIFQLEAAVLRFDAEGMDTRDFMTVANRRGFVGRFVRGSIGRIKEAVDAGTPPILALPGNPGHALVAVGYNDRTQELVFAETAGYRVLPYAALAPEGGAAGYYFFLVTPGSATELFDLGEGSRRRGDYGEAEAYFRMAAEREPGYAPARAGLGDLLRFRGLPEESEAAYREALRLDPSLVRALNNLADLLVSRGAEAAVEAESLADRAVTLAEAEWGRLQRDHAAAGIPAVQADLQRRMLGAMQEHLSALGTLGQARMARGDAAGALDAWRTALRLAPEEMREFRARRHVEVAGALGPGQRAEALQHLERASSLTADASLRRRIETVRRSLSAPGTGATPPGGDGGAGRP